MSNENLLKQKKSVELLTGMLIGALLMLLVATIFLSIRKGFMPLTIVPFGLLPIVFLNLNSIREIKKVLNSRKEVL